MAADPAASTPAPSTAPPVHRSALLGLPGAVPAEAPDAGVAWHYGDPIAEQRAAARATGLVDLSHRDVLAVPGRDRLTWLHALTSQAVQDLADGVTVDALILSPKGHVEHHLSITELGGVSYLDTEPGRGADLLSYLESMRFWSDVQPAVAELALLALTGPSAAATARAAGLPVPEAGRAVTIPGGFVRAGDTRIEIAVPRTELGDVATRMVAAGARPVGSWAVTAQRIADRRPRLGVDTDDRTIPNEVGWLTTAVHLDKGCYRGQETVARVHNLGRPPRRLVLLNLDGSVDTLPAPGDAVLTAEGRTVGRVGSVAHHHESGPIALALVKRAVAPGVPLLAGGVDAFVDPDDAVPEDGPPTSAVDRRSLPTSGADEDVAVTQQTTKPAIDLIGTPLPDDGPEPALVRLADIEAAVDRIRGHAVRTPLLRSPWPDLWLKPESLQPIGAFKIRGAVNAVAHLDPEVRARGILAHSSGNHAQAVAYAARAFGVPAHIVIPDNAPQRKIDATLALGATIELVPLEQRFSRPEELQAQTGRPMVPPFDHPDVIAGQGTIGLEIAQDAPDVAAVLVPVSGGGLVSGVAAAIAALLPDAQVIAVEPELAGDAAESFRSGRRLGWAPNLTARTIADGLRTFSVGRLPWAHIRRQVADVITVSEDEIRAATAALALQARLVAEPSGAVATAAHLFHSDRLPAGRRVAIISGGNIDPAVLRSVLADA